MILEIVTPEATLLHSEVDLVSVPGVNGEFQMLNNHAPIVSLLVNGTVKFKGVNIVIEEQFEEKFTNIKGEFTLPIKSGTIEMKENKVIILAD
ncbi:F0F1 ATP synthase subunit epsilon [Lutibacter sp.]|uniref:F0F1 ATP synthase subunit epsilon n=1 Tax=Lutibacter sp. TaxID=1925666 RepID=UPI00356753C9